MLAQNFKTANELGLTELQHRILIKVLVLLETGELKHIGILRQAWRNLMGKPTPDGFNMWWWDDQFASCQSPGCIAGWGDHISGGQTKFRQTSAYGNENLHNLFMPAPWRLFAGTKRSAQALRSYLTMGQADW